MCGTLQREKGKYSVLTEWHKAVFLLTALTDIINHKSLTWSLKHQEAREKIEPAKCAILVEFNIHSGKGFKAIIYTKLRHLIFIQFSFFRWASLDLLCHFFIYQLTIVSLGISVFEWLILGKVVNNYCVFSYVFVYCKSCAGCCEWMWTPDIQHGAVSVVQVFNTCLLVVILMLGSWKEYFETLPVWNVQRTWYCICLFFGTIMYH